MDFDCLIRNGTVVLPSRSIKKLDIGIRNGKIAALLAPNTKTGQMGSIIDASGLHVMPGIIDAHIHWGLADRLEQYTSETKYAAEGGVTTVVGYLTGPAPYSTVLDAELEAARSRAYIDFGFHVGVATDEQKNELPLYINDYGISSMKFFMNYRGDVGLYMGMPGSDDGFLYELLEDVARLNALLVVHPENIEITLRIRRKYQSEGREGLWEWRQSKPPIIQAENAVRAMYLAEHTHCPIYFPHVTNGMTVDEVVRYRQRYDQVWMESCPIYLTHSADMNLGTIGKGNPPLETREHIERVWSALASGHLQVVATDHVPRKLATKHKPWWEASQGWPGTAMMLPVMLSEGYHKRNFDLADLIALMTTKPARMFGLHETKGDIAVGLDADFTLVDLDKERTVTHADFSSNSDYTPYEGWRLKGWPVRTIVRGVTVMENGKVVGTPGHGRYLHRQWCGFP